jgi:protein-disulfide isomerase
MTPSTPESENLTRKQRRDQAREQRKATEEATAAEAARRRRLIQLGGVAAVVVVAIVAIVIATSKSKNPATESHAPTNTSAKNAAVSTVESELNGIPQSGNVLGKPNAPVTMQYFGDLECPYCREFTLSALPSIIQNEVRTGKLKIEYKSMETATRNPPVFLKQQSAAYAAGKQNKAWYFIELFYNEQGKEDTGYATESYFQGLAEQVPGLNLSQWHADRKSEALEAEVLADEKEASEIGFTGTPSFMLGKTGQKLKPFSSTSLESSSAFEPTINKLAS